VTTFRYIASRYALAALMALVAVCAVYLMIDFADRAKFYSGPGVIRDVLELYGMKAIVQVNQLLPAALAIGGAVAISGLRRTGEVTALSSLGRGPLTFVGPVAFVSGFAGLLLFLGQDAVVAKANLRVDEITALRFHRWGDWGIYHRNQQWFRGNENRFFYLDHGDGEGFGDVTIYEVSPEFRLARRTDAVRIVPLGGGEWKLVDVQRRTFQPDGSLTDERLPEIQLHLTENLGEFRVRAGKPSQVALGELPLEISLRQKLGLQSREWELALHERRAYQATGIPAALLGMALALRPKRRGHLTAATAEGFGVTLGLWATSALSRTLSLAGHLPPWLGGTFPLIAASLAAFVAIRALMPRVKASTPQ
jgi:lipopolysaccharide export system permease protein